MKLIETLKTCFFLNPNPFRNAPPIPDDKLCPGVNENSTKYDDAKVLLDELVAEQEAKVTRGDFIEAQLASLMLLHPEVKEQKPMIDFVTRLKKYQKEHL